MDQLNIFLVGVDWGMFWTIISIVLLLMAFAVFAIVGFLVIKFKYSVQIIERRGLRGQVIRYDWGRVVQETAGVYKLHLLKSRQQILMPEFKHITILTGNYLKKQQITIYKGSQGSWSLVDFDELDNSKLEGNIIDSDVELYMSTMEKQDRKRQNKKGFEYWVAIATPIVSLLLLMVFIIIITKNLNNIVGGLSHVASVLDGAAKELAQCTVQPYDPPI